MSSSPSARLGAVIRWSALALSLFSLKVLDDALSGEPWRAGIFFAVLLLQIFQLLYCRRLLRLGRFDEALKRTIWGSLAMFAVGAIHADDNPSSSVIPVVIVAIALPHVDERRFIRFSLLCLGALLLNVVVVALWPLALNETPLEHALGHIFATSAAAGVALLLFWQIKESLVAGKEAREKASEEAGLEEERYRKVLEATGEGIWLLAKAPGP